MAFQQFEVTLTSFKDEGYTAQRIDDYFAQTNDRDKFKFPLNGKVVRVGRSGELVVIPEYPGHAILLNFFNYQIK